MKLVHKYSIKSINIYIKINFIIIFSILILERFKIKKKINPIKEKNHYFQKTDNKKIKEAKF